MHTIDKRQLARLLAISIIALLVSCRVGAAAPDLSLAGAVTSGGTRSLALVAESGTFDLPIVLRRNENGASAKVCVDVTPLIGPSGQQIEASLTIKNQADTCIDMAGLDKLVTLHLSGKLPAEGDYKGQLGLVVDGATRTSYDLTVQRKKPANPVKIGVVGVGNDGRLTMTSDRSEIEWPIALRRDDNQGGSVAVQVRVSPFTGPSGAIVELALQPGNTPLELPPLGQSSVKLTGKVPGEGTYTGEVSYVVDGVRTPVTLVLTRTKPDFDFKVDPISKLRGVVGDDVKARITINNATSVDRPFYWPVLRLDRIDGSGSAPVEVAADDFRVSFALDVGAAPAQSLSLPADGARDFKMVIKDLDDPGNYKGTLRFTAPDRKPLIVNFELAMRLWWGWAALAIFVGVASATALRLYQQQGRPRLLLQRQAIGLRTSLQSLSQNERRDLIADEQRIVVALVAALDEASDQLADVAVLIEAPNASVEGVRRKLPLLPLLIAARRRLDAVRPIAAATKLRPTLTDAHKVLLNDKATEQDVTATKTALEGIEAEIEKELRSVIATAATKLQNVIKGLDPGTFQPVTAALDVATATPPPTLEDATKALNQARLRYVGIASQELRKQLAKATAPVGFNTPEEWQTFVGDIGKALDGVDTEQDPERKVERWNGVNRLYLTEVVKRAKDRVDELVQRRSVAAATATLQQAQTPLAKAVSALQADDLAAASVAYKDAMTEVERARPEFKKVGATLSVGPTAAGGAPDAGASLPPSIIDAAVSAIVPLPLGRTATLNDVDRSLTLFTVGLAAVVLVFAIASGLQVLYMPNAAFGWWDVVVAFLWGAGLQAVAGQTFQGLQGLAHQFR